MYRPLVSRTVDVDSIVVLVSGAVIAGMMIGIVTGSLWALAAPAIVGILYLLVVLPGIVDVTTACDGWCSSQTTHAGLLRIVVTIYILGFGILPGMGGAATGIWLREKIDQHT